MVNKIKMLKKCSGNCECQGYANSMSNPVTKVLAHICSNCCLCKSSFKFQIRDNTFEANSFYASNCYMIGTNLFLNSWGFGKAKLMDKVHYGVFSLNLIKQPGNQNLIDFNFLGSSAPNNLASIVGRVLVPDTELVIKSCNGCAYSVDNTKIDLIDVNKENEYKSIIVYPDGTREEFFN
ncbi:hypothetical protein [Bacillus cereus group sp. TH160LC]|uniref:hypothetical protein n=1 Tax=Bacillus cereus group sp. TH160LC TaxID=3018058 RepID=UPI0022E7922C|nr:hypothetical protein [Bacillus cereus group sp. TH160LC]MDA1651018.1 hypothetical protein [Bacillus cereus group sp. TH160LC]